MREDILFSAMADRYGQTLTLRRREGACTVKAFFQPVREKEDGEEPTVLGLAPRGLYLYLGAAENDLKNVEELEWNGQVFEPVRHRRVQVGDRVLYHWAVFRERDEVRV